jgi:hemoglobin/transferrin/lactoferrin receptor protein
VGSYADSGRDYLDLGLINRVEILRGPASVLYGSQALGGVVLMQTLSGSDLLTADSNERSAYQLISGYRGDRDARYAAGHGAWGDQKNNFLIAMGARQQNERTPAKVPTTSTADRSDRERQSVLLKQQSTLADNSTITMTLDLDELQQDTDLNTIIGIGRFSNTTDMYAEDRQSRVRASIHHEWLPSDFTRVSTRLYTQRSKSEQTTYETRQLETPPSLYLRGFTYEQEVSGLGVDVQHDAVAFNMDHRIGVGIDLQSGSISQQRDGLKINLDDLSQSNIVLNEVFPRRDFPLTNTLTAGIYVNDEISLPSSSIVLIPGLRYDAQKLDSRADMILQNGSAAIPLTDQHHDRVTGNLGMRWPFAEGWSLYAQYAQGFRAPPPSDVNLVLYYELPVVTVTSLPNANLKPETSDGYEIGINLDQPMYNVSLALFDNHYEDFIQSRTLIAIDGSTTPPTRVFQSINVDKARIYGAELRYRQKLAALDDSLQSWSVEVGAEWLRGINRTSDQPLRDVGPPKAVLALEWSPADSRWAARSVNTFVRHHQRVDQTIAAQVQPAGYSVHDLTADYSFARHWTLRAGVFNLTDKSYYDWSAVAGRSTTDPELPWLASSGRHASLSLQGKF